MDLPFVHASCAQTSTQRSAGPLGGESLLQEGCALSAVLALTAVQVLFPDMTSKTNPSAQFAGPFAVTPLFPFPSRMHRTRATQPHTQPVVRHVRPSATHTAQCGSSEDGNHHKQ